MTTENVSFPWFFAAMCYNFASDYRNNDDYFSGVFLYTTEQDGKVYANMTASDMNAAVRIRWTEEYLSGQSLAHLPVPNHAVQLRFMKEHFPMMKDQYMRLTEVRGNYVDFDSVGNGLRVTVPMTDTPADKVANYANDFFDGMFFGHTREEWEARKLNMAMPCFIPARLEACNLKKYGFDKVLDKWQKKQLATLAWQLFGLRTTTQIGKEDLVMQDAEGLHGIDFPGYPKDFRWYKDVSIQVVVMPLQQPHNYYQSED